MRYVDLKILTIQIENVQSLRRKIIFDFILTNEDKVSHEKCLTEESFRIGW